jgi:hypothetical protein
MSQDMPVLVFFFTRTRKSGISSGKNERKTSADLKPVTLLEPALVGRSDHDLHHGEGGDHVHVGREHVAASALLLLVPGSGWFRRGAGYSQ